MVFNRRKRSASVHHQPLSSPAAQSAQSAASHAFLKSQPSSASLSSAAAAAALRNSTPTPTPIENVQTKRMVQRRSSTQSQVNPVGARRSASVGGTLRRSSSNGSMSARTFRDQSPHRPATSSGPVGPLPVPVDVPPLPAVPTQYTPRKLPTRRALSMEPSIRSPPSSPPRAGARGVDREHGRGSPIQLATHQRVTGLGAVPELERSASRNSVNFSYPLGSRPTSPIAIPENNPMSLHDAIQESIADVSDKHPMGKPRAQASSRLQGSPIVNKSGPLAGTAVVGAQAAGVPKGSSSADVRAGKVQNSLIEADPLEQYTGNAVPAVASVEREHPSSRPLPARLPSTVQEEEEPRDNDTNVKDISLRQGSDRVTSASPTADHVEAVPVPSSPSTELQIGQQPHRQSSSPGRTARFSRLLSVAGAGDQVHQPPPRSVSPVKSALKHPRGTSLSPNRTVEATGRVLQSSELSDGTSVASDEGSRVDTKKKSAKVSFDDEAEIVNPAASPPTSPEDYMPDSPSGGKAKSRMSWLGVGKKKSPTEFASDDDWDVVMKPRQVLPSFGSIRGSRGGGLKRSPIPDFSDNESSSSTESDMAPRSGISPSNSHPVNSLPPKTQQDEYLHRRDLSALEQLSVNGTSHKLHSDSSLGAKRAARSTDDIAEKDPNSSAGSGLCVPAIAVEPATPPADETKESFDMKRSSLDQYRIPGEFPPSTSDRSLDSTAKKANTQAVASAVPKLDDLDAEESSGDSIYSDAAEDIDGDGFGSINAIVDGRSAPRSAPIEGNASESRDATPRPIDRAAIVDSKSQGVTDQPLEDARCMTPTQDSVNRLVEESPASSVGYGLGYAHPPMPADLQTRIATAQNGSVQAQPTTRTRPMSVDVNGTSRMQDPRWSSNDNSPRFGKAKQRPLSLGPNFHNSGDQSGIPGALRRKMSNGSDSSSSFKRSSPRGDPHSLRRTMRAGGAGADVRTQAPAERNESPLEHRPLSSGSSNGTMRKTLRGPAGGERYSFFSTNKKAPPRAKFTKAPPKSARTTRFTNSDGEDEARPQVFRSRFADSSDEEPGSNKLRPVRGIPRRQGADDGDSTELEDSSEESARYQAQPVLASQPMASSPRAHRKNAPNMSGMAAVAKQRGMSQRDLEEFIMAPPRGRKAGLLTRLGIKKPKNSDNRAREADVESPSRRDIPLEPSPLERDQLRSEGLVNENRGITTTTVSAGNPEPTRPSRLVKRNSKRQSTGANPWPLHSGAKAEDPLQPVAEQPDNASSSLFQAQESAPPAEGAGAAHSRGALVNGNGAHSTSPITKEPEVPRDGPDPNDDSTSEFTNPDDHGSSARDVVIAGSGRKKRFPLLRKAFGLRA